jgi:ketosteroid isomerase-like protein
MRFTNGLCLALLCTFIAASSASFAAETVTAETEQAIRDVLMNFGQNVSTRKIDDATGLLSEDVVFIDNQGEEIKGRKAVAERLQLKGPDVQVTLHPESIQQLTPDVALVVGSVGRNAGGVEIPLTRFSTTLVNKDNHWLIAGASELRELAWLEGTWKCGESQLSAQWGPGKNFLELKFTPEKAKGYDNYVIGWDPNSRSMIGWHFDSVGGFAQSHWTKQPQKWVVDSEGTAASGYRTRSLSVLTPINKDEFTWETSQKAVGAFLSSDKQASQWRRVTK